MQENIKNPNISNSEYEELIAKSIDLNKKKEKSIVDGKIVAQTGAIARFCGKLAGLYPSDNDFNAAKVDEVIDLSTDITLRIRPALKEKNSEKSKEMRRELVETVLPHWLGFLETLLEKNGKTGYFVDNSLTVADLAAWRLC